MDLGSCQYSDIGDRLSFFISRKMSVVDLMRNNWTIEFTNIKDFEEIKENIKQELILTVKEMELEEEEELVEINICNSLETMDDFFNITRDLAWDLWSACKYISDKLGIVINSEGAFMGLPEDDEFAVVLYFFLVTENIQDAKVYCGFDT